MVSEMRRILDFDDPFPLSEFPDVRPHFKKASIEDNLLSPQELVEVSSAAVLAGAVQVVACPTRVSVLDPEFRQPAVELDQDIRCSSGLPSQSQRAGIGPQSFKSIALQGLRSPEILHGQGLLAKEL